MEIELINFQKKILRNKLGILLIKYGDLHIKCDLVYSPTYEKIWIRMPEVWLTPSYKLHYCCWSTKKKSDEFQKEVLKKLIAKYSLDFPEVKKMHEEGMELQKRKKLNF